MKKLTSILLVILAILSITAIGCKSQNQSKTTVENKSETDNFETRVNSPKDQAIFEENEEKDNTEINNRYKNVNKSKIDYTKSYSSKTYITYSSGQGNFVVGFSYDYNQSHTDSFNPDSDKDIIVGIDYMKEIS